MYGALVRTIPVQLSRKAVPAPQALRHETASGRRAHVRAPHRSSSRCRPQKKRVHHHNITSLSILRDQLRCFKKRLSWCTNHSRKACCSTSAVRAAAAAVSRNWSRKAVGALDRRKCVLMPLPQFRSCTARTRRLQRFQPALHLVQWMPPPAPFHRPEARRTT